MIDFSDPQFLIDPYPALKELRAHGKPVWHEGLQLFLAPNHEHANAVFRTKTLGRIFKERTPEFEWEVFNWLHSDSLLDSEPPKHTRLRSLVAKAFNRQKIEGLRPDIERLTQELIEDISIKVNDGKTFDLIADFAEPLPVKVIAALLGFPASDEHLLRPWSQSIVKMYEVSPSLAHQEEAKTAAREFADYVRGLMLERKVNPGSDLISDLAAVEEGGEKLNAQELVATCVLLLNAGHEASVNAFGNGMVAALRRPDQAELLRSKSRDIAETAVEEFLRFDAPLHLFERTATQITELGGVTIEPGQKIAALIGSANRDADVFDRSDGNGLTTRSKPTYWFWRGYSLLFRWPISALRDGHFIACAL